ncbi:MAG: hypothetical protein HRT80_16625 [Henriciella sp.]|nr:hypothetical protein [Henriciella sp.]
MEGTSITVEMADYRSVDIREFTHLKTLFDLADFGIERRVARTKLINYNIFAGALYGIVPVLRLSTAYAGGEGVCLSQVVASSDPPPIMGKTAILSAIDDTLIRNEKQIASSAFQIARVQFKK